MIMNIRAIIEVAERLIVIAAAAIAVFPLYQWYNEAEDRRLDRVTGFISAGAECQNFTDHAELLKLIEYETQVPQERNTIWYRLNMANMCSELLDSLWAEFGGGEMDAYLNKALSWGTDKDFGQNLK